MNNITKIFLTILAMAAVLGYNFFNYSTGRIDTMYFLVFSVILGIPLLNMVNILIREPKNK